MVRACGRAMGMHVAVRGRGGQGRVPAVLECRAMFADSMCPLLHGVFWCPFLECVMPPALHDCGDDVLTAVWVGGSCSALWGCEGGCVTVSYTNRARHLVREQVVQRLPTGGGPLDFFDPLAACSLSLSRGGLLFFHSFRLCVSAGSYGFAHTSCTPECTWKIFFVSGAGS
ncbi:regulator of sigma E protease [Trypanosoma cruzi]|nr:regulator of sigma E protease [Trypanosoma cruzi]